MSVFVMLSHESRAGTARKWSMAQLAAAGIIPHVIESVYDGPNGDAEVRRRAFDALEFARGDSLVFFEDDVRVNAALFRAHLRMAEAAGIPTAFCAVNERHYSPGITTADQLPIGLAPIPNYDADRGFHGSMAVYLPAPMVAHGLAHPEQFMAAGGGPLREPIIEPDRLRGKVTGFDFWVKATARQFGGMLVALPNSVDHDDRGSVRGSLRKPWRSPTYGHAIKASA